MYISEKENLTGNLVGPIFYGIVVTLFLQCMGALLNPASNARGYMKWGLVAHTVAMFLFVTVYATINLNLQSISYVDNRGYPGSGDILPPGPFGYQSLTYSKPISLVSSVMFQLNQWLADGLLLYRCHVIYSVNHWIIAFPCLMYLATFAMGIMVLYAFSQPGSLYWDAVAIYNFSLSYYSISLSLNVLLTLLIVIRVVLHSRKIRNAMGTQATVSGVYKAIITILIESFALYAVSFLLYIATWGANSTLVYVFNPILPETQVIAPFLITLRVANRRALTKGAIASGNISSLHFASRGELTDFDRTFIDGNRMNSMNAYEGTPSELYTGAESTIQDIPQT